MAGTPTIATRILSRLSSDADLTALLTGGIYDRELKRLGDGATPNAFAPTPPHQVRPAAVVRDGGDVPDPFGPGAAQAAFVSVWLYAPSTANGKAAIADAIDMVRRRLLGWQFSMPNGTTGIVDGDAGRLGVRDDPVLTGTVVDNVRFQIAAVWRLVG